MEEDSISSELSSAGFVFRKQCPFKKKISQKVVMSHTKNIVSCKAQGGIVLLVKS